LQYLLTEEELTALKEDAQKGRDITKALEGNGNPWKENLQMLCTLVADHAPTWQGWNPKEGDPKQPWGCIRSPHRGEWYCDECPVKDICPSQWKNWSQ